MENISIKKEIGKFLGLFLILYLTVFLVLNITGWLVRPPKVENSSAGPIATEVTEEKLSCVFSEKPNSILLPKIGIEAPIVLPESQDEKLVTEMLNQGVVYHPSSVLPGQEGWVILLGHSAPVGWPKIRYDWVFSDLNKLEAGDEVFVFFDNCQYLYKVSTKIFLDKGEDLPKDLTNSESVLVLISCWPPGKDIKRIAVMASLTELDK